MPISHWADPAARTAYRKAYEASLELWPVAFEESDVPTPFGATHVVVSGNVTGEPIVLVHAASLTATQWYLQAAELATTHRLYAIDIMGDIGLSTQTREIHSRIDAAAWLLAVLDGLHLERPILIGSSFGGFQVTNLAVRHRDRVRALVLLAPAATIKPFKVLANLLIRAGSLVPMPFSVKPGLRGMMEGSLPNERIVRQMEIGVAGFRYDRAGVYPSEMPDGELARIACPALLFVGDRERIYDPIAALARARRLIGGLETELVPGAGHLPGMQVPDLVDPRIRAFLDRRVPARPEPQRATPAPVPAAYAGAAR